VDGSKLDEDAITTPVQTFPVNVKDSHGLAAATTTTVPAVEVDDDFAERVQRSRFGTKRLLAVRVSNVGSPVSQQEVPDETRDEIEAAVFGTGRRNNNNPHGIAPNDATLCAQYKAVSHGQLSYEPALVDVVVIVAAASSPEPNNASTTTTSTTTTTTTTIREASGVMELSINITTMIDTAQNGVYFTDVVKPAILARLEAVLLQRKQKPMSSLAMIADHILLCLPTGTLRHDAAAMGDIAGMYTYYHYGSCAQLPILMHELGHNLNFYHADVNGREYADLAGYMGGPQAPLSWRQRLFQKQPFSSRGQGYPKKAFDGHHHWLSGWFANGAVTVEPALFGGSALYRLVSFVDYSLAPPSKNNDTTPLVLHSYEPKPVVLIRVGSSLYIQYNRAKGYNRDTPVPNRVTITQAWSELENASRVAALAVGQWHRQVNYTTTSRTDDSSTSSFPLVIQVCSMVRAPVGTMDYADISIHIDDGVHSSSCPPRRSGLLLRRSTTGSGGGGDGTPVTAPQLILNALQVADPVRTVFGILILLCGVVLCCLCVDACCLVYVLGCCQSRACTLLLLGSSNSGQSSTKVVVAESKLPPSSCDDDDDASFNGTTLAGSTGTSEAEEFA
jgi:hypothetical protein